VLRFFVVDEQAQLVDQLCARRESVERDQLEGESARLVQDLLVTTQVGQPQVGPTTLTRPEQCALAAQVEIDLGEGETVIRFHQRLESANALISGRLTQ